MVNQENTGSLPLKDAWKWYKALIEEWEVEGDFPRKCLALRKLHLLLLIQAVESQREEHGQSKVCGQMWGVEKEMKVKQGQYDSE